ncbi:Starch-binding associating with outer membrane [Reichenbachiella faecimaris]|uniref:Starch-binding associating with outer membrane n=1 Tax=Reichenbachiella faecimaris TaxID=692418 RepID=A0A1W2GEN7_REIFA|nr:RagB/SusD family nutrient uptake outer membrane protein [Reichenbachiella faecimaris]SMD35139.1 Starch-binding associating with outer membrane [Reichenbachiella faecimaris]
MKKHIYKIFIFLFILSGCEIDDQVNPNNQSLEAVLLDAKHVDLNNLVTGILARMRESHDTYVTSSGTLARELYLFDADPRNRTDLLGANEDQTVLDNNTFYTTGPWNERYRTIKNCNILVEAAENANESVSTAERNGYIAFANTIKAHQFLLLITYFNDNGIRLDVADPDNLGTIQGKSTVYGEIVSILDDAETTLGSAEFAFTLTSGFEGFDTPATFATFNNALAARAELYAGNYANAITELGGSFIDLAGDLTVGPKMSFSTAGADILNGLFKSPDQNGNQIVVNNGHINDAETGDLRVSNKMAPRVSATTSSGVGGTHETRLYATNISPVDIIRNEELILIQAEAMIMRNTGSDLADAVTALDIIRNAANIGPYTGLVNQTDLIDEMLHQRRYSLWGEGHRMADLRRFDRLNEANVPVDVIMGEDEDGNAIVIPQIVFTEFPIPATEPE